MNTISAADMRRVLAQLDRVKELTDLLRRAHPDVPHHMVYAASGSLEGARAMLTRACITNIAVEPVEQAEAAS